MLLWIMAMDEYQDSDCGFREFKAMLLEQLPFFTCGCFQHATFLAQ